jgi:hypothetical protein
LSAPSQNPGKDAEVFEDDEEATPFINDLDAEINRTEDNEEELAEIMRGPTPITKVQLELNEEKVPQQRHKVLKGESSKFFFILKKRTTKPVAKKREMIPVNEAILALAKKIKRPFIKRIGVNLEKLRSFVVFDLAPTTLPLVSALDEAKDVLKEITTDNVQSTIYGMIVRLASAGVEIKTATFIAKYLKLNKEEEKRFFERVEGDRRYQKDLSQLQKVRDLQGAVERTEALVRRLQSTSRKSTNKSSGGLQ